AAGDMTAVRSWDFEAVDAAGAPLVRVRGLVNVFFHVPHRFYQLRRDPLAGWLGAPLAGPQGTLLWKLDQLDEEFCAQSNAIFLRILAHAVLSFEEREAWRALGRGVRRRREWLLGRLAIKEAVRYALQAEHGEWLYPSDIVVRHDAQGAPFVDGWWTANEYRAPSVSLSHNSGFCLAALGGDGTAVGVDAEIVGRVQRPEWLATALTPAEGAWLAGRPAAAREVDVLRLWCAKEAAAKRLGCGLQGQPEAFEVAFVDSDADEAVVRWGNVAVPVRVLRLDGSVIAVAEGDSRVNRVA
ncbi:MAG TPA: 4'-phosphopantetheinyl transferase superfamily protein, partial [Burkholderiaceae bacterium]|nr:4'-phosphopantetheinyl transferase superfamily protein [Burkholderiaceae bacterium]